MLGNQINTPFLLKVNVDFPPAIVEGIDEFAALVGVTRQSLIKVWIAERLQAERKQIGNSEDRFVFVRKRSGRFRPG
jgi:hypothetical protein